MNYNDLNEQEQQVECYLCSEYVINQDFTPAQWHEAFCTLNPLIEDGVITRAGRLAAFDWLHARNQQKGEGNG